jgi:hypothetical protein
LLGCERDLGKTLEKYKMRKHDKKSFLKKNPEVY